MSKCLVRTLTTVGCVWGTVLVLKTWTVWGGSFLCPKLGVCGGGPFLCLKLVVCDGGPSFASNLVPLCVGGLSLSPNFVYVVAARLVQPAC